MAPKGVHCDLYVLYTCTRPYQTEPDRTTVPSYQRTRPYQTVPDRTSLHQTVPDSTSQRQHQ
jgi:hypothetical protein